MPAFCFFRLVGGFWWVHPLYLQAFNPGPFVVTEGSGSGGAAEKVTNGIRLRGTTTVVVDHKSPHKSG